MEHGLTADQVLASLWRRRTLVFAVAAVVFVLGAGFVMSLPNIYQSAVVVRVDSQRLGQELVQQTVGERIEQRLLTVRQELLSRPVLQRAIIEMKLYPKTVSSSGLDRAVEQMRKDLEVKVEGENAFELTYQSRDAEVAAQVANRLPEIFAEEAFKSRHATASRATELFSQEVNSLQKQVAEWEQKISQFKIQHAGELPEQLESNMRSLERISTQLQSKSEELRSGEGRRFELARTRNPIDSEEGRIEAAEAALTRELVSARTNWTEDHPEVKRLERELKALKSKKSEGRGRGSIDQERDRVAGSVTGIRGEMQLLQKQADQFQARIDNTPRWAHELSVMNRDYEVAKAKYQSLVGRKVEAELSEQMETKNAKSMFNIISPASTPFSPAKPDRLGGLLLSLLAALGLGVLSAIIKEMRDDSIQDSQQIRDRLPVPLLAVIPNLATALPEPGRRGLLPEHSSAQDSQTVSFESDRVGFKQ